ncbi:MAG: DUF3971 domain-containing protein, partial [Pseudomonadota bacterium]
FELDGTALGWRLQTRDLYVDRGAQAWPSVTASLSFDEGPGGASRYHLELPFARLDDIWPLAELLPPGKVRQSLVAHRPVGDLQGIDAIVEMGPDRVPAVTVEGRFDRLGWSSAGRIPGVTGLTGRVRTDGGTGQVTIDTDTVTVTAPHLFTGPLSAWRLTGSASWSQEAERWSIQSDNLLLATEHFDALANASISWVPGEAPFVDFDANIGDLDIVSGLDYLPVGVMKPRLVTWLTTALKGGTVRAATLALHGALDQFPFDGPDQAGEFTAVLDVEDLVMDFAKDWPAVTEVDSRVRFEGRTLDASVSDGLFGDARVYNGQVGIDDLKNAVVEITVGSRAPLETVRDYIFTTPVGVKHQQLLSDLKPRGPASTSLSLQLPVRNIRSLDYQVDIEAAGATLGYRDWPVDLEDIRGTVIISRSGVFAPAATGVLLSRPVSVSLDTAPLRIDGVDAPQVLVQASGRTDANVFAERIHPPLADIFSGVADWE